MHYSGICSGGPFDGKPLHHPEARFELIKSEGRLMAYQRGRDLVDGDERGAYVHVIDRWEWINAKQKPGPAQIHERGRP